MANAGENDGPVKVASHKGGKIHNFIAIFSMTIFLYVEQFSKGSAARHCNVDRRIVAHWMHERHPNPSTSNTNAKSEQTS